MHEIVTEAVENLCSITVSLADLEYRVELEEEPLEKFTSKSLSQPYQATWLLMHQGKTPSRGDSVGFVKMVPFRLQGRQFTVKPTNQANLTEIDDCVTSLYASLSQVFAPMKIRLHLSRTSLSDFT